MDLKSVTTLVMKTILLALPPAAVLRLSRGSELGGSCRAGVPRGNGGFRGERYLENARPGNGATEAGLVEAAMVAAALRAGAARTHIHVHGQRVPRRYAKCDRQDDGIKSSGVLPEGPDLTNSTTR
jgi:hypothetical protein